jgi:signal transduction histidine kinase
MNQHNARSHDSVPVMLALLLLNLITLGLLGWVLRLLHREKTRSHFLATKLSQPTPPDYLDRENPIAPIRDRENPIARIPDGENPIAPIRDGENPIAPIRDGENPIAPIRDGENPIAPIRDRDHPSYRRSAGASLQDRFIEMICHEYRTPLTTILTTTELLERYGSKITESKRQRYTQRIKQSIRHMIRLLNDALLLEQYDRSLSPLRIGNIELTSACQDIVETFQITAPDTINIYYCQHNCPEALWLDWEEITVQQILGNLLSNAIKFSPAGGMIQVELLYEPLKIKTIADGLVILRVQDQGIGIPAEDQPQVCDRFYRGSNIGTIGGTGLGLAIVQRCVQQLGGTLQIQSSRGTLARVTLPIRLQQAH